MPEKVLVHSRFPRTMLKRFAERFDLMDTSGRAASEVFPAEDVAAVRAMISAGGRSLGDAVMDQFPSLGAIICYGTGYDGIDLKAARERGIVVGHSPGANASSVADIAVTLMLAAIRRLVPADDYVRKALADDAAAGRYARTPGRRLWHGRDRAQDRSPCREF
jgi:hydroxypyruvate reductase